MHDCLLKGARVVDPSQGIDGVVDIALKDGKIGAIENDISPKQAKATYELRGKIVTPGLIDAHCHPVLHFTDHAVHPDEAGVNAGVLLVNDAGSAGPANFHTLREMYFKRAKSEMTFFLNIASSGLIHPPEIQAIHDIDIKLLKSVARANKDIVKGLKLRLFDNLIALKPDVVQLALDAADELNLPLMVHIGGFRDRTDNDPLDTFSRSILGRLRQGDILSHYMTWRPGGMVLPDGSIFPELKAAKERGVLLDCSHGKNNFSLKVAKILIDNGLAPDIISTDLSSMGLPYVQSLLVTMSKLICQGLPLYDAIAATTCKPARALGLENEWGSLRVGRDANISILEEVRGDFPFVDGAAGNSSKGDRLLEPRMVIRNGEVLPCRSFYHLINEA